MSVGDGLKYTVTLEDQMSGPAKKAAEGAETLHGAMGRIKEGFAGLTEGFHKVIEPTEVMKGAFEGAAEGFRSFAQGLKSGEAKEVVAGIAESLAGLSQLLDLVVPGLGQAASALIKVGGAFASVSVGLIQSGAELAIEATQGKLAMIGMFDALGGGVIKGEAAEEMLTSLSAQIGVTKDELAPFTQSFLAMGVTSEEALKKATLASASALAIMGKEGPKAASTFVDLSKKIQLASDAGTGLKLPAKGLKALLDTGTNVNAVAAKLGVTTKTLTQRLEAGTQDAKEFGEALQDSLIEKGKGPLDRMSSSLGSLKKMFSQSIGDLFEDMGDAIKPFLDAVKDMFHIFDSNSTNSGKAMKTAIGGTFTFIFAQVTKVVPVIKHFFQDIIIYSLKAYIYVKQHWSTIKTVLGYVWMGLKAVGVVLAVVATAFGVMAAITVAVSVAMYAAVGLIIDAFMDLPNAVRDAWKVLKEFGTFIFDAGVNFVNGFVDGIKSGITKVEGAVKDMGKSALNAISGALAIHSPSLVLMKMGGFTAEGFAAGISAGAGKVASASAGLGDTVVQSAAPSLEGVSYPKAADSQPAKESSGGGNSVSGVVINITAPSGVTNVMELTETAVSALFERYMLHEGA